MLYSQTSPQYVGSTRCPVLAQVQERFTVRLSASLNLDPQPCDKFKSRAERSKSRAKFSETRTRKCILRIVIFGMSDEQHAIGDLLSEAGLFLQHPTLEEYGGATEYCNPHFLVRPGTSLAAMGSLPATLQDSEERPRHVLVDTEKNQLMQVFDSIGGSGDEIKATASPRIITPLQEWVSRLSSVIS